MAHALGIPWAIENPAADRGDRHGIAWWETHADHAPLWMMPCMQRLREHTAAAQFTFAQCAFGAATQKWTTVWCPLSLHCLSYTSDAADELRCADLARPACLNT